MRSPNQLRVVGERLAAQDGAAKVKGTAIFTADRALPGMLHAKVLRSPHAHARIRRIDVRRAAQHPGVHAVVTGKDLAGLNAIYGVRIKDQPVLAIDKVRYYGDVVAAVVADDEATAFRALALIDVDLRAAAAGDDRRGGAQAPGAPLLFDTAADCLAAAARGDRRGHPGARTEPALPVQPRRRGRSRRHSQPAITSPRTPSRSRA